MEVVEERVQLLKKNDIFTLKNWTELSKEDKNNLCMKPTDAIPIPLRRMLDEAAGEGIFDIQLFTCLGVSNQPLTEQEKKDLLKKWISIRNLSDLQQSRVKFLFHQFVHREEGLQKVVEASLENLSSFEKNQTQNTTTQQNNFIILSGGSGSGKTRAACEIGHILRTIESKAVYIFLFTL